MNLILSHEFVSVVLIIRTQIAWNCKTYILSFISVFYQYLPNDKDEMRIYSAFLDAGVYVEPGTLAFYSQTPGFFRILFSLERKLLTVGEYLCVDY